MPADASRVFFDSNTLLYLISDDTKKAERTASRLLDGGVISVQVLNEFVNVARQKHRLRVGAIRPMLADLIEAADRVPVTLAIHERGLDLIERHNFSTCDAMIAAAALDSNCHRLLSEDMHHGLLVDGALRIENPFLA